jgi:outer membrane protein TolC
VALDALRSTEEQVRVAEEGLTLAEEEVAQAQRRYQAGVTSSLEVTDAGTRLERARENRINALVAYNAARLDLGQAMGAVRQMIP